MKHLRALTFVLAGLLALAASAAAQPRRTPPSTNLRVAHQAHAGHSCRRRTVNCTCYYLDARRCSRRSQSGRGLSNRPVGSCWRLHDTPGVSSGCIPGKDLGPPCRRATATSTRRRQTAVCSARARSCASPRRTDLSREILIQRRPTGRIPGAVSPASDGPLYGRPAPVAVFSDGTVFSVGTNGALMTLKAFTGTNGSSPQSPPGAGTRRHAVWTGKRQVIPHRS